MRIFTQRWTPRLLAHETAASCWFPTARGAYPYVDDLTDSFDAQYPNARPLTVHPLDYCIVFDPEYYVVGKYWGDESNLQAVQTWVAARDSNEGFRTGLVRSSFVTCDDSDHPATWPLEKHLEVYPDTKPQLLSIVAVHLGSNS